MGVGLLQPWHLLLILLIVLIVFGAGKLGQVGGALGQSVREFKSTVGDGTEETEPVAEPVATKKVTAATATRPAERKVDMLQREEI